MSYSCRNSHWSPFLHSPRSQCLQTTVFSPLMCRNGHMPPFPQAAFKKNSQTAAPDLSMPGKGSGCAPSCCSTATSRSNLMWSTLAMSSCMVAAGGRRQRDGNGGMVVMAGGAAGGRARAGPAAARSAAEYQG